MVRSRLACFTISMVVHLPFAYSAYLPQASYSPFNHTQDNNPNHLSAKKTFEISIHGILLWASLGFLMPIGILIIRMSNREECANRLKFYFYFHLLVQMISVLLGTAGAIMSIKTFENSFNNKHQRIGLVLYAAIWVQAVLGFLRPHRGARKRSLWYILHWIFGTIICIIGILNIYTGLDAYQKRTKTSVGLWKILFTAQIIIMSFIYLFQDKWQHLKKQGVILGEGIQVRPSNQEDSQLSNGSIDLWKEPCSKANALKNLFK
ncbi:hypothetical protein KSS87_001231 [Heliosperma pusillum]|nr:hypothetical protein KSS87_001231 [Heliosperma pusillum]